MGLAPSHELVSAKAAVGAQQNARFWPSTANLGNDACHLVHSPVSRIDICSSQLRRKQMTSTENVKRQIAITVAVSVKEPPLLFAVHRVIGAIKIKNNLVRCAILRLQEQIDHQLFDRHRIMTD